MRTITAILAAAALFGAPLGAQENNKPVPKDSMRVSASGCTKGYIFTAGPQSPDQPTNLDIPDGMHLRMNGPKQMMADIKTHEGSMIEITGLVKKGQDKGGVGIGGGVRISPGSTPTGGSLSADPFGGQILIDVEGWRPMVGACRSR